MDPAVSVEHRFGDPLHHTVNWLPEILRESLEETADTEDGEGELVVKSEGRVVYQTFLQLEERLKTAEYREHSPVFLLDLKKEYLMITVTRFYLHLPLLWVLVFH